MRTLESLRNSCVDKDSIITFEQSTQSTELILPTTPINCSLLSHVIESGFYLLSCRIMFQFDQTAPLFSHDKVYTAIKMLYHVPGNSNYSEYVDITNAYASTNSDNVFIIDIKKPIYILPNSGNFNLQFFPQNFSGNEEPVSTSGTSSAGVDENFKLVEWDDDFVWDDKLTLNNFTSGSDIEDHLIETHLCDFIIVNSDSHFSASVQFQCFLPTAFPDESLPAGIYKAGTIPTCHLIIKTETGTEISRNTTSSGSYQTFLDIATTIDTLGTYSLYASGACHTTYTQIGNYGYIDLLVSRCGGGSKNSLNHSTAKSTASLRSPVFKQLTIDGTTTEVGTYLSQTMAAGVHNLPNYSLVESSLTLRRIF